MRNNVAQQIIVPVYYYVGEDGSVTFDIEQMNEYFQREMSKYFQSEEEEN